MTDAEIQKIVDLTRFNMRLIWGLDAITRFCRALHGGPHWPHGGIAPGGDEWKQVYS